MGSMEGLKENAEGVIVWSTDTPCAQLWLSEVSICTGTTTLKSEPEGIYPSPSNITARSLLRTDDQTWLTGDCSTAGLNAGCY